jgi:hypothetical protein
MVVLGLLAGLLTPVDLVWCSSANGHSAIENALVGCCGADGVALSCVSPAAITVAAGESTGADASGAACRDVPLGTPAYVAQAPRQHPPTATPAGLPVWAHVRAAARPHTVARCRGCERQLRDTLRSTVLTL